MVGNVAGTARCVPSQPAELLAETLHPIEHRHWQNVWQPLASKMRIAEFFNSMQDVLIKSLEMCFRSINQYVCFH